MRRKRVEYEHQVDNSHPEDGAVYLMTSHKKYGGHFRVAETEAQQIFPRFLVLTPRQRSAVSAESALIPKEDHTILVPTATYCQSGLSKDRSNGRMGAASHRLGHFINIKTRFIP